MDPRDPDRENGLSWTFDPPPPPLRRRLSMEEDFFYQHIMTAARRPSHPPPYAEQSKSPTSVAASHTADGRADGLETLPAYSCTVQCEGVFEKKMEIEHTIRKAEFRNWHTVFVCLTGTALNIHNVKKDWGWGKSRGGPTIEPDNPPWVKKAKLEKSYSLLHADVGIAADYQKRRYVIRVRAEDDQFLLSCIELTTFVQWLDALFAAIDLAAPIDDRDFPRDQSIPRIQRIRWYRGQSPVRRSSIPMSSSTAVDVRQLITSDLEAPPSSDSRPRLEGEPNPDDEEADGGQGGPSRIHEPTHRLSTTSYPNEAIDYLTGKWAPDHQWSSTHDLLYAKLCYAVLLFKSPRKSNYIISKGKQWVVDWSTGRMVRVLPPAYGEVELFGPWQVIHTENRRI